MIYAEIKICGTLLSLKSIYMKKFYDNEYANYKIPKSINDLNAYFENKLEINANNFALKTYNDNKETIDKTFELGDTMK